MQHITVTMTEVVTYSKDYTVEQFAERMNIEPTAAAVAAFLDSDTGGESGYGFIADDEFDGSTVLDDVDTDECRVSAVDREWEVTTRH